MEAAQHWCEKMGHHVPAHSAELHPVPDRAVYLKYPSAILSEASLSFSWRAAAELLPGLMVVRGKKNICSRSRGYHRAECGHHHDRGYGIPTSWDGLRDVLDPYLKNSKGRG